MEPITTELRKLMTHTVDGFDLHRPLVECDRETFERLCDEIDAVHEGLERENESLRRELDRVLGELEEMHKTDGISDNSSSFMHNAEHHAWAPESHYVMLPKDADGEYIHIGDKVTCGRSVWEVTGFRLTGGFWGICCTIFNDQGGSGTNVYPPSDLHHYHTPTVEDLIRDAILSCIGHSPEYWDEPIAEYAAKLQLREN